MWEQSAAPIIFLIWLQMGDVKDNLDKSQWFQFVGKSFCFWKKKDWICPKMFYARIFCRVEALKRHRNWQPGYTYFYKDMGFTGLQQRFHKFPGFRANHPGRLAQEWGPHISTVSGFKCYPASQLNQHQRCLIGGCIWTDTSNFLFSTLSKIFPITTTVKHSKNPLPPLGFKRTTE